MTCSLPTLPLIKRSAAILVVLLSAASQAEAAVIVYDNFGPANGGNDYDTASGWGVQTGPPSFNNFTVGDTFTPSTTGTLSDITVALEFIQGVNAATVSLRADTGGVPGAVLESWTVSSLPPADGTFHTPTTVSDVTNVPLNAGTHYWVVIAATANSSRLEWMFIDSGIGARSHAGSIDLGASWETLLSTQGAFRVTENLSTSAVPEPASLALWSIGVLGIAVAGYLRRPGLFQSEARS